MSERTIEESEDQLRALAGEDTDHDRCPLCGFLIFEDEESVPVWSGENPASGTTKTSRGFSEQPEGRFSPHTHDGLSSVRVHGKTLGEFAAAFDAIANADGVEVETNARVREVKTVDGASHSATIEADAPTRFDSELRDDKAGARLTVEPPDPPAPDAVMHDYCHEAVFGGGD